MTFLSRLLLPLAFSVGFSLSAAAQTVWFVDAAATPGGNGSSWGHAFDSIDAALRQAVLGDSIWVKIGTYVPTVREDPNDPRSARFSIAQGVSLYGGFDGTETSLSERAGRYEETILSGDRGVPGDHLDNLYHVVRLVNFGGPVFAWVKIDGFTIRDGYAEDLRQGGGVEVINIPLWLKNNIFRNNRAWKGGALSGTPGRTVMSHCQFIDNRASSQGGAIWGQVITYKIGSCVFRGNQAQKGGALFLTQSHSIGWLPKNTVYNSLFYDNSALEGGAVFMAASPYTPGKVMIFNSTIAFNSALQTGGGVQARTETSVNPGICYLSNCIVWGNTAPSGPNLHGRPGVAYSNIEGGVRIGGGNISADPLFVDGVNRDLRLLPGSPSNDSGNNYMVRQDRADVDDNDNWEETVPIDLDGHRRFRNDPLAPDVGNGSVPIVDMGAYEL